MPAYNDPSEPNPTPKVVHLPELNHLDPSAQQYGINLRNCRPRQYEQMKAAGTLRKLCEAQGKAFDEMANRLEDEGVDSQTATELARNEYLMPEDEADQVWEKGGQPEDGDSLDSKGRLRRRRPRT